MDRIRQVLGSRKVRAVSTVAIALGVSLSFLGQPTDDNPAVQAGHVSEYRAATAVTSAETPIRGSEQSVVRHRSTQAAHGSSTANGYGDGPQDHRPHENRLRTDDRAADWQDSLNAPESHTEISGRVLTRLGWPVAGIEVVAELRDYFKDADSTTNGSAVGTQRTLTSDDGSYAFRDLPAGIYMVGTRESTGYSPARIEVRTGVKYADLVLDVHRIKQVRGIVTDTMRTELEGVRIMPLVKGIPEGAISNARGEFQFAVALRDGVRSFPVRFQRQGYGEKRVQVTQEDLAADGSMTIAVTMKAVYQSSSVSGRVSDTNGAQAAGETVRLYSPSLKRNYDAVADAAGEFLIAEVEPAGDYQLWVRPLGPYHDYTESNIDLTSGSVHRDIELERLNRGFRLSGRILDQDGQPVPDFTLTLRSKSASSQSLRVASDRHGDFEVENVPEGELIFESRTTPYYSVTGLRLSGTATARHVDLVVNRGPHTLLGKVVDSYGRPIAAPRIFITSSQVANGTHTRLSSSTSADVEGHFLFTDLSAGQHTVTVNAPGYEGVRVRPVVGDQSELVVQLEKNPT